MKGKYNNLLENIKKVRFQLMVTFFFIKKVAYLVFSIFFRKNYCF